jgi:hypothetical protein
VEIISDLEERNGTDFSAQSPVFENREAYSENVRQSDGKFLLCHYFDYIVGTSTGGFEISAAE